MKATKDALDFPMLQAIVCITDCLYDIVRESMEIDVCQ